MVLNLTICPCRHGFGHWDQVAGDVRLGLDAKLEAAAVEKHGRSYEALKAEDVKHLPKGACVCLDH